MSMQKDTQSKPKKDECGSDQFKSKVALTTLQSIYLNMSSHWNEDKHAEPTL
jgi:hypothetical protein